MKLIVSAPETDLYDHYHLYDLEKHQFIDSQVNLDLLGYDDLLITAPALPQEIVDIIIDHLLDAYIVGGNTGWAARGLFINRRSFKGFMKRWFGGVDNYCNLSIPIMNVHRSLWLVNRIYELLISTDFEHYGEIYGFDLNLNEGLVEGLNPWHFCDNVQVVVHDRLPSDYHHVFQTGEKMADVALVEGRFACGVMDVDNLYFPPVMLRPRDVFNEYLDNIPYHNRGWSALSRLLKASLGENAGIFMHTFEDGYDSEGDATDVPILEEF